MDNEMTNATTKKTVGKKIGAIGITGVLGTIGLTSLAFVAGVAVAKSAAKPPVLTPMSEAKWVPLMKEGPLPAAADIQGESMKGSHFSYLKLPAGFVSPPHAHSYDYWSVVVQGKMTHWAVDGGSEAEAKQLGIGDVTFMPAKTEHVSKCFPGAECIMVSMQKGKFDFLPAKESKAEKAAKAAGSPAAPAAPKAPQ